MESQLSLTIDDLKGEIGHYLGYGRGTPFSENAWSTLQTNNITACLKSGLSNVYTPPSVRGGAPHRWSFLRPIANIVIEEGVSQSNLPADFAHFEGTLFFSGSASAQRWWPVPVYNIGRVEQLLAALPDTTGAPQCVAVDVVKGTTNQAGSRYRVRVYPTTDAEYTLRGAYKYLPDVLTGSYPYPPGGAEHAELFKAAMIAAAELQLDDARGSRWEEFLIRLEASIFVDNKKKGTVLGYNGDKSDRVSSDYLFRGRPSFPLVTYNGEEL